MAKNLSEEILSEQKYQWTKLEVLDRSQKGDEGIVEFKAYYIDDHSKQAILHEQSVFQRIKGQWFYVGGEVS